MLLLALLVFYRDACSGLHILHWRSRRRTFPVPKETLHLLKHMIPIKLTCNRKQHVIGPVALLPEFLQILSLQTTHTLICTQHQATQSGTLIELSTHKFENPAHRFVIAAADLLQDDTAHLL